MAKKQGKVKGWFKVTGMCWDLTRIDTHVGSYVARGVYLYSTPENALRAAERLSAETGWPVVEK